MESLSRRDLQKFCLDQRESGILPPETKCNGSQDSLLELLSSSNIIDELEEEPSKYGNILRHLAPYLTLDKLILILSYYPWHPLLEEVKDPEGKIWSDRTWVELGEAPLNYSVGGTRYYHLWITKRLAPWGNLVVFSKRIHEEEGPDFDTGLQVRDAYYSLRFEDGDPFRRSRHIPIEAKLKVWALRPQGFSYLNAKIPIKDVKNYSKEIKGALSKASNWTIIDKRNYQTLIRPSDDSCYALDPQGILRHYRYDPGVGVIMRPNPTNIQFKYVRQIGIYLYGITTQGDHLVYIIPHFESPLLFREEIHGIRPQTFFVHFRYFDGFFYCPEDKNPKKIKISNVDQMEVFPMINIPQMVKGLIYLMPNPSIHEKIYEQTSVEIKNVTHTTQILGINGKLYKDGSFQVSFEYKNGYKLTEIKSPYRFSLYDSFGIAW